MPRGGAHHTKPTALKVLHNTMRPESNRNEPIPPDVPLEMPEGLDAYGRQAWQRNAHVLEGMQLLTAADVDLFVIYCDCYSQWRRASIVQRKLRVTDPAYRNVAITVEKARDQMRLIAGEFGMTPSARSRLHVAKETSSDPVEEWMNGSKRSG